MKDVKVYAVVEPLRDVWAYTIGELLRDVNEVMQLLNHGELYVLCNW